MVQEISSETQQTLVVLDEDGLALNRCAPRFASRALRHPPSAVSVRDAQASPSLVDGPAPLRRTWMLYEMWCAVRYQPTNSKLVVLMNETRATTLVSEVRQWREGGDVATAKPLATSSWCDALPVARSSSRRWT